MGLHRLRHKRKIYPKVVESDSPRVKTISLSEPVEDSKWAEVMDAEERYEKYLDKITKPRIFKYERK